MIFSANSASLNPSLPPQECISHQILNHLVRTIESIAAPVLGRARRQGLDERESLMADRFLDSVDKGNGLGHGIPGHVARPCGFTSRERLKGRYGFPSPVVEVLAPFGVVDATCPPVMP